MLEWIKDKGYYRKRANTLENELEIQRKAHAMNTVAWTKQIENFKESEEYKDTRIRLYNKTIKELREKIRELEEIQKPKLKRDKNGRFAEKR